MILPRGRRPPLPEVEVVSQEGTTHVMRAMLDSPMTDSTRAEIGGIQDVVDRQYATGESHEEIFLLDN
jgi:hypothetical protein